MLRVVIGKLSHASLGRAFEAWKSCLAARTARLLQLKGAAARWRRLELGCAFNEWKAVVTDVAAERAERVSRLVPSVRRAFTPTLRAAFTAWQDVAAASGLAEREQQLLSNVVQRLQLRQAAAAFRSWRERAHDSRHRKCRLVLRIGNRVLSEAFDQWCAVVACLLVTAFSWLLGLAGVAASGRCTFPG